MLWREPLKAVELEPQLQPLDGEAFDYKSANKDDEARSDIKCCGFWSNLRQAYLAMHTWTLYKNAERAKIREYKERR